MFEPSQPPRPPGRILAEDFLSRGPKVSQGDLADRLGISRPRLNEVIQGKRRITPDTALRLGRCFGTGPELWLEAQARWDLYEATRSRRRLREVERIEPLVEGGEAEGEDGRRPRGDDAPAAPASPPPLRLGAEVAMLREGLRDSEEQRASPYLIEFLERRGMLAEARRFARIRRQLDGLRDEGPRRRARRSLDVPISVLCPPMPDGG